MWPDFVIYDARNDADSQESPSAQREVICDYDNNANIIISYKKAIMSDMFPNT